MQVDAKIKRQLRLQNASFLILFLAIIGLLAWLSTRYTFQADWTANKRNSLSEPSISVLQTIDDTVTVDAFVTDANAQLSAEIKRLIGLYQRENENVKLNFIDPNREPALIRELGISLDGELLLKYQNRSEKISQLSEESITNALHRLIRSGERWLVFIEGHDERKIHGGASYDFSNWSKQLENKGLKARGINLTSDPQIPDNTAVLVLADPQKNLLEGEIKIIQNYLDKGGNFLWLVEPGTGYSLEPLAEQLGIELLPGLIVDPNTQILGISDPRFALVPDYPPHPISQGLSSLTVFPAARGLEFIGNEDWDGDTILETLPRSWAESDEQLSGDVSMDQGLDIPGPLAIGLALTRIPGKVDDDVMDGDALDEESNQPLQRAVVIGDADFLSNAYLGEGSNMDLGLSVMNWLSNDDELIDIPASITTDNNLELSNNMQLLIGFGFLLVIPALLMGSGIAIWWNRRKG